MPTLNEKWEEFWEAVAPPDAGEFQRQEMKRAFVAGAWQVLTGVNDTSEETIAWMDAWKIECVRFNDQVKAGNA